MVGEGYFLVNAAMCLCALPLGGRLSGLGAPKGSRLALSAALGGGCALCGLWLPSFVGLLGLPAGVALCFGREGRAACLRALLFTLCAAFLLAGAAEMLLEGGASPPMAILGALAAGMAATLALRLLPAVLKEVRQVEITVGEKSVLLPAMLDSGNLLRDPVTNVPVVVIPRRAVNVLLPGLPPGWETEALPPGFRLLSVRTAAGSCLLPLFRPDRCRLYVEGKTVDAKLWAAVAGREYGGVQALVPLAALPREE